MCKIKYLTSTNKDVFTYKDYLTKNILFSFTKRLFSLCLLTYFHQQEKLKKNI